jgi:hypothetical protein
MKRPLTLALLAAALLGTPAFAGTFGLFYHRGHCGSCCSLCVRPVNAFTPITCAADVCGGCGHHGRCCGCMPFFGGVVPPNANNCCCPGMPCDGCFDGGFAEGAVEGGCATCMMQPGVAPAAPATSVAASQPYPGPMGNLMPQTAQPVSFQPGYMGYPGAPMPGYAPALMPAGR